MEAVGEKVCTKCGRSLPATPEYFRACKRAASGLGSNCRDCSRAAYRQYFADNRDAVRAKIHERDRAFQPERSRRQAEKRQADPEAAREADRLRRVRDGDRINARCRKYCWPYRQLPINRLRINIASVIGRSLPEGTGKRSWESLVGYTLQDLASHLEKQFQPGMSWSNYGKRKGQWSVDHIRPLSSFAYGAPEDADFKTCWSLANLQPLWHVDNIRKGNKWAS